MKVGKERMLGEAIKRSGNYVIGTPQTSHSHEGSPLIGLCNQLLPRSSYTESEFKTSWYHMWPYFIKIEQDKNLTTEYTLHR